MKYYLAGNPCEQVVSNMRKQIENVMRISQFYSPLSFLRRAFIVDIRILYRLIIFSLISAPEPI